MPGATRHSRARRLRRPRPSLLTADASALAALEPSIVFGAPASSSLPAVRPSTPGDVKMARRQHRRPPSSAVRQPAAAPVGIGAADLAGAVPARAFSSLGSSPGWKTFTERPPAAFRRAEVSAETIARASIMRFAADHAKAGVRSITRKRSLGGRSVNRAVTRALRSRSLSTSQSSSMIWEAPSRSSVRLSGA